MRSVFVVVFVLTAAATAVESTGTRAVATSSEDAVEIIAEQAKDDKQRFKIAIFAPYMANSQVLWNKRVAEELMKAGHDVTIYGMYIFEVLNLKLDIDPKIRVVPVNGSTGVDGDALLAAQGRSAFNDDIPMWHPNSSMKAMRRFGDVLWRSCGEFIKNKEFLAHVESSNYDIAFTHMYHLCPIGIIHKTKIPTWIWLNSGALMDSVASLMGVPVPPSYCSPAMMDSGDKMTFVERTKSFMGHLAFKLAWRSMTANMETAAFREEFGEDFPDLVDLAAKAPLVMVNSNELYDFARPTLSKIVNIGGIGIKKKDIKPLEKEFASRVDNAKGIVVMTFGSYLPMYLMPDSWKEAYFHAFAQFPDVQFFIRYEKPEEIADRLPPNAYAVKWLPQTDLLQHPKSIGLISHGGYNSVQDALHAGVPMLATGLNANLVERLGMGVNVRKATISNETVTAAIRRLVEDKSLKVNARRLQSMIATKPVSAETLLVRWTEFLAQHKRLDNLVPYGTQLSFFVYHSLDVICFLSAVVLTLLTLIFLLVRGLIRCCRRVLPFSKAVDHKKKE